MLTQLIAQLKPFLHNAKHATCAGHAANGTEEALLDGTKQLEFSEGDFLYRDIFVGKVRFAGQEMVYHKETPFWSMTYAGGLLTGTPQEEADKIYAFLRQALRTAPEDFPIRGAKHLAAGDWRYICEYSGNISAFHGKERISCGAHAHYELHFAGGIVV